MGDRDGKSQPSNNLTHAFVENETGECALRPAKMRIRAPRTLPSSCVRSGATEALRRGRDTFWITTSCKYYLQVQCSLTDVCKVQGLLLAALSSSHLVVTRRELVPFSCFPQCLLIHCKSGTFGSGLFSNHAEFLTGCGILEVCAILSSSICS